MASQCRWGACSFMFLLQQVIDRQVPGLYSLHGDKLIQEMTLLLSLTSG